MKLVLRWMTIIALCCAAGALAGEGTPDARLQEAQTAFDEGLRLQNEGKYAEAIAKAELALALRQAVFGGMHPEVAACLNLLGILHVRQGNHAQAEPLLQRGLEIREATLGKSHLDVATSLNSLAVLYRRQGLYERAEPLLQRALAIKEAALGKDHLEVTSLLNNLSNLYADQGLYERSEQLLQRTLAIQEAALGKDHPEVAATLENLGICYIDQGMYDRAEPLLQRALAIEEAALGKNHPIIANTLNSLAVLFTFQGLYGRAGPLYERVLAIREASLGKDHPDVAQTINNIAELYWEQGLYSRAERLLVRALAILEAALGPNHRLVATSLDNLALLYSVQGEYGQAERHFQRALTIREAALGPHHPDVARTLNNFANILLNQGLYGRAEQLLRRALAIREAALGKAHPHVATSLESLANVYKVRGLYGRARPLYERALTIEDATLDKNHPATARTLINLGGLYTAQGLYAQAEPALQRALAIQETVLGSSHPEIATTLGELAQLRLAQHRLGDALQIFTRAFGISEQRLRQEALDFSESRLASFLQLLRTDEERLYALLRAHPENDGVRHLALAATLLLKGRSAEEMADTSRTVYRSLGAEDRATYERLRGLRTQLATLSFKGPGSLTPADYQRRLKELADQGDALEADLARRSAPLRALTALPAPTEIARRVATALPKDGALIEFIAYTDRPLVPKSGTPSSKTPGQLRYLALALLPNADIRARDLGPATPIDQAALRLRNTLANRDASFQASAQALYELAFKPLLPLLGETRRLFLSPDGQLSLVPFAALHDGHQFLVDTYDFTYLTSGKELLPRSQDVAPPKGVVVFADPDFGASPSGLTTPPGEAGELAERSASLERFFSTPRAGLAERSWTPLPGTRQEAEAIRSLVPRAQLFLGSEATKERLLHLPTPGVLHLATHGFFLEDAPVPKNSRAVGSFGALGDEARALHLPDPLLRSGLVLAGAHVATGAPGAAKPPADTALATALELAGLNLWGTELVVLSACDTGRGDVKLGQGVYGLRRALIVAGAETVVMSLWKVNDETTRELMEAYYRKLLAGQGRATALREAMSELRQKRPHPHYWAPFIVLGQDPPLRALAPIHPGSER
jgi:tetratricopeptide (TPR) repeat protein